MNESATQQEQMRILLRGCENVYTQNELGQRLAEADLAGRPLRIKLGLDPTAPDIHLGHTVVLRKMRQFQDFGHKAVLIIGDYTARIGDPSGANKTRPVLSPEQIESNATTYFHQAGQILDTAPDRLEIRYNSQWLDRLTLAELLRLASRKTVAQMIQRDSFRRRLDAEQDVFLHEMLYPIMQGYDSVCVQSDVELGGTDQTFNNLVGRDLQKASGQKPQIVIVMPILAGLDGREKMSKTKGNYIGVTDEPNDMFGKAMSIPDDLMRNYFTLLTDMPAEQIKVMTDPEATHPRKAKAELGRLIVEQYYDKDTAEAAAAEFDRVYQQHDDPTEMPEIAVSQGPIGIVNLICLADFAESRAQAKRLVKQGAVSIDRDKIDSIDETLEPSDGQVLKVGKHRFGRLTVS